MMAAKRKFVANGPGHLVMSGSACSAAQKPAPERSRFERGFGSIMGMMGLPNGVVGVCGSSAHWDVIFSRPAPVTIKLHDGTEFTFL